VNNAPLEPVEPVSLEDAFAELETIIRQLESGELALTESMRLFERGRRLTAYCQQQLDVAELRISQLLADDDGALRLAPLS
jgi:exodeoxyribonuclease VII small subunit